jgi:hypothetical protein
MAGSENAVQPDKDLAGYKYARALSEQARSSAAKFTSTFKKNWDFLFGKDHFQVPATAQAIVQDEWRTKSTDNLLFALVDDKAAIIGKSELAIHVEDLDDKTTYWQRLLIAERMKQEMERLKWRRVRDDLFLQGSATGIGAVLTSVKPDPLTGDMQIVSRVLRSDEIFNDPEHDNSHDAAFMVWEPTLPMSTLRAMFPSKAAQVKPDLQRVSGNIPGVTYKSGSGDDNMIYGGAQEYVIDSQSQLKRRTAKTCFVWINDTDSIIEELKETVIREAVPGYQCTECSKYQDMDQVDLDSANCPDCGAPLVESMVPPKIQQNTEIRRAYPYGRLIVYSGDTLLYDGENPLDIEGCYPIAVYHHYRFPGYFYGWSDVALLWSNQIVRDVTVGQGVDYIRLGVNSPFEYPIEAIAYGKLTNGPNQPYPVPFRYCGAARRIPPDGFDVSAWQSVLQANERSFQLVGGRTDLVAGFAGSPPPSGVAVEATTAGYGSRVGAHVRRMEDAMSDWVNQVYQLLHQHDSSQKNVQVGMPNGERQTVPVSMADLPKNIRLRISISTEEMVKDKIAGQNMAKAGTEIPGLIPERDMLLGLGISPQRVKEIEDQKNLEKELQAMAPPPPMGAPPEMLPQGGI